jgi:hypothetical protein
VAQMFNLSLSHSLIHLFLRRKLIVPNAVFHNYINPSSNPKSAFNRG